MNAVEIEEEISKLAEQPFDPAEFPYAFLEAFGNKPTVIKKIRSGHANKTDISGAILQQSNIHMAACAVGEVPHMLEKLRSSPATAKHKAKFILATDGQDFQAEDMGTGETVACEYKDFPNHFGFFLALAGITTVKQIRESSFDIRATSRLNKLYMQLLQDNPEWGKAERRHDMNHFMARLIFCFYAEDTGIFNSGNLFTATVDQMTERDSSNTHEVISEIFRAMNTAIKDRATAKLPRWADTFPYVNGGLFSGSTETPRFSKIARTYLLHVGSLDWKQINPDIFGSMIQAVTEDDERGALGMHYTSVPNILKVLNPLFLDDLRAKLEEAGDNQRMLLNLRKRMSKIRVFDPACGSGNFLVIAYKQMREIEAAINKRRGEEHLGTEIPITNFRGIELKDFPAEVARLALIMAEYQCDVLYRGQTEALAEFLPLDAQNWITCGNALRLDWLSLMGVHAGENSKTVKIYSDDLFGAPLDQAKVSFENEGGETYICGNPPYQGSVNQTEEQKSDMAIIFSKHEGIYKDLDYVACWLVKAAEYNDYSSANAAFVTTNSICQGEQVAMLWSIIFRKKMCINFAHTSFLWKNNAANNAGVTCAIIGISKDHNGTKFIYEDANKREVRSLSPYLIPGESTIVTKRSIPISTLRPMAKGNQPTDGGNFILDSDEKLSLEQAFPKISKFIRRYIGSSDFIRGDARWCLWIENEHLEDALKIPELAKRVQNVQSLRANSKGKQARDHANTPHRFVYAPHKDTTNIVIPRHFSSRRQYITVGVVSGLENIIGDSAAVIYEADLISFSLLSSRLHFAWISTVCGRIKTDIRYSNTLGWNTFPIPLLTEKNKTDLTRCAEDILLAREAHFPSTIADLYDPDKMPENLRHAHERNDEVLERIYIGRRFKNDTERLEKLFDLYTKMTATKPSKKGAA